MTVNASDYFRAFKASITRIYHANGAVVGAGFLVSKQYLLTCAHVITQALGIPQNTSSAPTAELVDLDFPLIAPGQKMKARVIFWRPVQDFSSTLPVDGEDIAALELQSEVPLAVQPVRLVTADDLFDHPFRTFGFPSGHNDGVWAGGVLRGEGGNKWVQMEAVNVPGYQVEPGFSGAPVWDETLAAVVGMAVAAERQRDNVKSAFMIPTKVLSQAWSELEQWISKSSLNDTSSNMFSSFRDVQLKNLKQRISILIHKYEATYNQLNLTLNEDDKVSLRLTLNKYEQEIQELEEHLRRL